MPRSWLAVMALTMLLAACVTAGSDAPGRPACPTLIAYPPALQARAADELAALPAGSALAVLVVDYGKVRDQIRICRR